MTANANPRRRRRGPGARSLLLPREELHGRGDLLRPGKSRHRRGRRLPAGFFRRDLRAHRDRREAPDRPDGRRTRGPPLARHRRRVREARPSHLRAEPPRGADRVVQGLREGVLRPPRNPHGRVGGKGVLTLDSPADAEKALALFFGERVFGAAGDRVLVEEFLRGSEASFLAICDGTVALPLPTARDYKKVYDGDRGPNTGGMGGHSPSGVLDAEGSSLVYREIVWPTLRGLAKEGRPFRGVLYAGVMVTDLGPKVLEFNARFGDPETEVLLPRVVTDLAAVLRAALTTGELEKYSPLEVKAEVCAGIVLCAAGYPGVIVRGKVITGLTEASQVPGVQIFHGHTQQEDGQLVTAGGRVMVVTATAPSLSEATARAYEAADKVQFEGKHYRRDIGAGGLKADRV